MTGSKTASRYAKALFLSSSTDEERRMHADALRFLSQEIKKHPHAEQFFQNPFIPLEEKKTTLKKAFGKGEKLVTFLELLIKNNRFKELQGISFDYQNFLSESTETLETTLVFAEAMDSKTKDIFKEKLEKLLKKKVEISEKIDPSILGGFVLVAEGKIIDLSLKGKLNSLKDRFHAKKI